jgi:excisionase family DNA binding protein
MTTTFTNRRLVSLASAASRAAVSTRTIRRRIEDGSLTGYRFGPRVLRVDLDEVDNLFRPVMVGGEAA